ncbi:MAG TPA: hypothetical protein VFT06_03710, partial [Flavisolibacter sp.]|nr:hypothetical protein [Flavisolibacter sp.]
QDGDFPDLGSHVKGEMGGLWLHPIKLVDGFWLKLTDAANNNESWLPTAKDFINYPYGNRFLYPSLLDGISVERLQYCPQGKQGVDVRYTLHNGSDRERQLKVDFVVKTDLSPVWFSKENNILDAPDTLHWDDASRLFTAGDKQHPWFAAWGASLPEIAHRETAKTPVETQGQGRAAVTTYHLVVKAGETKTISFVIAGSSQNREDALAACKDLLKNGEPLLKEKMAYYASILQRARIEIPDKKLQQAYTWGKLNTEWLVCDLPSTGRFLGAGAIEYPWLFGCDNFYALQGVVETGDFNLAKTTLRAIKNVSERVNGNGRIIHEMSTNGLVGNKGNSQETAQFPIAVWKVFQWTGDKEFLKEMYPSVKKGLTWLLTEKDQNGNLFPEGYGIMEVKGLNAELIDVAVYTQQALEVAAQMAGVFNEPAAQKDYAQKAALLKDRINTLFWDKEQGSYCDFFGTREQAMQTAKGAIEQLQAATASGKITPAITERQKFYKGLLQTFSQLPEGTMKGWFTNKNWVISTPMETGIAPLDQAIPLLDKVRREHCGEYGPYLSAVEKQSMMTIATGVQAMAECQYGRIDEGLWYVDRIVQTFGRVLPGSISEMMPDYGCPVQAWTIYGLASPLVTKIFGITPDAANRTITFTPNLPASWNKIQMTGLPVGSTTITFGIVKKAKSVEYRLSASEEGWVYTLHVKGLASKKYVLNGKKSIAATDEIRFTGTSNRIVVLK